MGVTRTDVLKVQLITEGDGQVRASLAGVAQSSEAVAKSTGGATAATAEHAQAMKGAAEAADALTTAQTARAETEEEAIARIHAMVEASLSADQVTRARVEGENALAIAQGQRTAVTAEQVAAERALIDAQTAQMSAYTALRAPVVALQALLEQRTLTTADVARAEALLDQTQASGAISAAELREAFAALDAAKIRDTEVTTANTAATVENAAAHINSRTAYSAEALITDAATGQFSRSKREIGALANETGLLQKLLSPLGLAFTAVAAAVGVTVAGFVRGERETAAWNEALIATDNAIGATTGQLESLTQTLGAANGNYSGAREAILALAKDGKVAAANFLDMGQAALDMSRLTGQSAGEAAKTLADLASQPAKAVQQYHLLTVAQYDQITALQKQGREVEAEGVAEHAYAQTLKQRAHEVQDSAGIITRAGRGIKAAWDSAWNAVDAIGRPDTEAQQLAKLQAKATELQNALVTGYKTPINTGHGLIAQPDGDPAQTGRELQQVNATIAALQTKMITEGFTRTNQQIDALATQQAVSAQEALKRFMTPDQKLADDLQQASLNKARALYGVVDPAKKAEIEAEFQREVHDAHQAYDAAIRKDNRATPGQTALGSLGQYVNGLDARSLQAASTPLTKYTDGIAKLVNEYDKAIAKGADVAAATAEFDKGQQALARSLDQTTKKLNEQDSAALTAYKDGLDKTNAALQMNINAQVERIGMGDREYALTQQITKAYTDQAIALQQLQQQMENDLANGMDPARAKALYDEKAQALRDSTNRQVQIVQNGYAQMSAAEADWRNGAIRGMENLRDQYADVAGQTEQIVGDAFNGMNDALANFVTTGKLNFGDLVRSILADLAKMELRIIESKILQQIIGYFSGAYGQADTVAANYSSVVGGGVALATGGAFDATGAITAFANGGAFTNGIVTRPTLFAFANGTGLMGEAGPEAIVPLDRGPGGKLGINAKGLGGGDVINVTTNVVVQSDGSTTSSTSGDNHKLGKQLAATLNAKIRQGISQEMQPGGILWKAKVGQAA